MAPRISWNISFLVVRKKQSPIHGGEMAPRISRTLLIFNTGRNSRTLFIFKPFLPHVWDSCFFQTTKNERFPLYLFLIFFSTRVLETHLGGLKAACIGPALSKFRPSVGDGAT